MQIPCDSVDCDNSALHRHHRIRNTVLVANGKKVLVLSLIVARVTVLALSTYIHILECFAAHRDTFDIKISSKMQEKSLMAISALSSASFMSAH